MARTRVISANKALYATSTGTLPSHYNSSYADNDASGIVPTQLHRIDNVSFSVDIAGVRQDIRELGQLARIGVTRTSELNASLTFGYYLTNGENEHTLGLNIDGITDAGNPSSQFISGILSEHPLYRERNIYVLTVGEGIDAFDGSTFSGASNYANHDVLGFGNAGLTSYSVSLAVGEIPRADIEMECGNFEYYVDGHSGFANPSVDKENGGPLDTGLFVLEAPNTGNSTALVLEPGDITISFSSTATDIGGPDLSDICIQSADISVPLSRTPIECIGKNLPASRPLDVPINATLSLSALVKDFSAGSLETILTGSIQGTSRNATITMKHRDSNVDQMKFILQDLVLDDQAQSQDLDGNETVDLTFSTQLGGATSTSAGIYVTGAYFPNAATLGDVLDPKFLPGATAP